MRSELGAVLFDMDGTLVNTEPLWMKCEYSLAEEYSAPWTESDGINLVGRSLLDAASYIQERMNLPLDPEAIVERMVNQMVTELSATVPWRAGAWELLHELHEASIPLALVTMSYFPLAEVVAQSCGLFSAVITGDRVARGKPFPDPYLQAAHELGVDARDCVAFEDSTTGAMSALAAGATTVVLKGYAPVDPGLGHEHWDTLSDRSVDDVRALALKHQARAHE